MMPVIGNLLTLGRGSPCVIERRTSVIESHSKLKGRKMLRRYLIGLCGAVGACLLFSTANAITITGGVGSVGGMPVEGIGNQCLEIGGVASTAPVVPVHSWDCHGGLNQQWQITDGQIQKIHNGAFTCLEVQRGSTATGAKVQLNYCKSGATYQQWVLNQHGEIVGVGSDKCLDWGMGFYDNGVQLSIQPCNGSAEQRFWLR
jgi:hypothetical protein